MEENNKHDKNEKKKQQWDEDLGKRVMTSMTSMTSMTGMTGSSMQ
jgi:hypothetical protein